MNIPVRKIREFSKIPNINNNAPNSNFNNGETNSIYNNNIYNNNINDMNNYNTPYNNNIINLMNNEFIFQNLMNSPMYNIIYDFNDNKNFINIYYLLNIKKNNDYNNMINEIINLFNQEIIFNQLKQVGMKYLKDKKNVNNCLLKDLNI